MKNLREKKQELQDYSDEHLLQIGLPDMEFYEEAGELYALCPFHADRNIGNFCYSTSKGVWKCFVCGHSGAGVYSLIMEVRGWDFKKTIDFLYENRNAPTGTIQAMDGRRKPRLARSSVLRIHAPAAVQEGRQEDLADFPYDEDPAPELLDKVYRAFVEASPLTPSEEYKLCTKRGLYMRGAKHFFRFPDPEDEAFWDRFRAGLMNAGDVPGKEELYHSLMGVPGFCWDSEAGRPWFVPAYGALGIVEHDAQGRVNGLGMRMKEESENNGRYRLFSAVRFCARNPRYIMGACQPKQVDIVYHDHPSLPCQGLAITEGKFKALHLSYLGYDAISLHGVNSWRTALSAVEAMDCQKVFVCFDSDCRTNPAVARSAIQLGTALLQMGREAYYMTWSGRDCKGIDDLINAGGRKSIRQVEAGRFIETTLAPFLKRAVQKGLITA